MKKARGPRSAVIDLGCELPVPQHGDQTAAFGQVLFVWWWPHACRQSAPKGVGERRLLPWLTAI